MLSFFLILIETLLHTVYLQPEPGSWKDSEDQSWVKSNFKHLFLSANMQMALWKIVEP